MKTMNKAKRHYRFAIIVPVYNVEKYIEEMINSLINQTFTDFALFLVNDGSTDSCLYKINKYKKRDDRVFIINKKNEGPGSARNAGLDFIENNNIDCDYIWFCDSDDKVDLDALDNVNKGLEKTNADYGLISVKRFDKHNIKLYPASIKNEKKMNNTDIVCQYFRFGLKWRKEPSSEAFLNNKFFKYEKVKNIRFREDIFRAEDFDYFLRVIPLLESGLLLPNIFYWYRLRKSSLTNALKNSGDLKVCLEHYKKLGARSKIEQVAIQHKLIRAFYLEICDLWELGDEKKINLMLSKFSNFKFVYEYKIDDYKVITLLKWLKILLPCFLKFRKCTKSIKSMESYFD